MIKKVSKNVVRQRRHLRVRKHIIGTSARPRLNVFRSASNIYAQIIDDTAGRTLVSAGTVEKDIKAELTNTDDIAAAEYVGETIAKRAIEKGINTVVFDRGGFIYQGKVAALAEAARKAGLEF